MMNAQFFHSDFLEAVSSKKPLNLDYAKMAFSAVATAPIAAVGVYVDMKYPGVAQALENTSNVIIAGTFGTAMTVAGAQYVRSLFTPK